jgi:hypothetical protein
MWCGCGGKYFISCMGIGSLGELAYRLLTLGAMLDPEVTLTRFMNPSGARSVAASYLNELFTASSTQDRCAHIKAITGMA